MMQTENAAAWLALPASSSSNTETAATWVTGVTRKITADSVTMLRTKKKTPTLMIEGAMIGRMTSHSVLRKPPPRDVDASSNTRLIWLMLVVAIRNPCA
jgi:hypothetical protein